jgi:putative inorganic carbon (HCO3(-)) transporter
MIYVIILLVRPQDWYEPLEGFRLIAVTAVLTVLAALITTPAEQPVAPVLTRNRYARLMWGMFMAVLLSQLSHFRLSGASDAFQEFGKICVLFFLTMLLTDRPVRVGKMMWVMVVSAAVLSISAFMQIQTGEGFGGMTPFGSYETEDFRVQGSGVFNDPNDFAMLFIVAIAFTLSLFQTSKAFPSKAFLACMVPTFLTVLFYTQSRGGVVGLGAMLLAYFWLGNKRTIVRLLLASAFLVIAMAFGPARARESYYEGSAAGRMIEWGIGNGYLKQYPIFGIGYQRWLEFETTASHNSFVTCYAELGLFGYFFWFALGWLVMKYVLRIARSPDVVGREISLVARGLFAGLVGFFTSAFFLFRTYNPVMYFLLGLGIGLIRYAQRQTNVGKGFLEVSLHDIQIAAVYSLLSIPAIWLTIKLYWARG